MSKYKAIFFDLHHTLIECNPSYEDVYIRIAKNTGISLQKDQVMIAFKKIWEFLGNDRIERESQTLFSHKAIEDWWSRYHLMVLREMVPDIPENTGLKFGRRFNHCFCSDPKIFRITDDAKNILAYLGGKEYFLFLATNADKKVINIIKGLDLKKHFSGILISEELGYSKPDPKFFNSFFRDFKILPKECLIVGDSYPMDMCAGIHCGMGTCLYTRNYTKKPMYDDVSHMISKLTNLKEIL